MPQAAKIVSQSEEQGLARCIIRQWPRASYPAAQLCTFTSVRSTLLAISPSFKPELLTSRVHFRISLFATCSWTRTPDDPSGLNYSVLTIAAHKLSIDIG
jgi:hypothetical protein